MNGVSQYKQSLRALNRSHHYSRAFWERWGPQKATQRKEQSNKGHEHEGNDEEDEIQLFWSAVE